MTIKCSQCSYENFSHPTWAKFAYDTPSGLISIPVSAGWCCACSSHVAIENFSGDAKLESLQVDLDTTNRRIEIGRSDRLSHVSWWQKLLDIKPAATSVELELSSRARWLSGEIQKPSLLIDYLNVNRAPRCLVCGSQEVIKEPAQHPGCGGEFYASKTNMRGSMARKKLRVYSLAGFMLPQEGFEQVSFLFLG
mgnify:CR=1 FL=1